ncbi:hypothetical protein [Brevundimonas sp. Root1279]|uniref:hypothetical protein n=1 Tax=Brevundimonas sp. Root1279 TaxID=1736443 RepID=UPI0006F56392|nr:hypothetical protein [Brevundimonas sp. Root1279]KQW80795.1 hypothetical protein ASC65_12525 [Brevundimonas sp. Root1279]
MKSRVVAAVGLTVLMSASVATAQAVGQAPPPTTSPGGSAFTRTDQAREEERIARLHGDAVLTPAEIRAAATASLAAAGVACQVQDATNPGRSGADRIIEVSCLDAPGLLVVTSSPPQVLNCLSLDVSAASGVTPSVLCALPANKDPVAAVRGYARTLGLNCTVDAAAWTGRIGADSDRYEIGCARAEGYWVEVDSRGTPTRKLECLEVARAGASCRFTTAEEQAATLKARFEGTAAAPCDVTRARFVGANADYRFYEAACRGDEGLIARFKPDGAFDEGYPCADAANIAGGCTLGRPED